MRYRIIEHDTDIEIHVHETGEHSQQLLASLQHCQEGRCGCPTDQYDRLEDMVVQTDPDKVTIQLHPRAGQRFDPEQVQEPGLHPRSSRQRRLTDAIRL